MDPSKKKELKNSRELTQKPWGQFKQYAFNEKCTVKIITVKPNQTLSLQSHKNRDELWVIIDEGLKVEIDGKITEPKTGDEIFIPRNSRHRLSSLNEQGRVLEISFGEFNELDITRFEDIYGRI